MTDKELNGLILSISRAVHAIEGSRQTLVEATFHEGPARGQIIAAAIQQMTQGVKVLPNEAFPTHLDPLIDPDSVPGPIKKGGPRLSDECRP